MQRQKRTLRIRVVVGLICLVAFLLLVRSYVVQIAHGNVYREQAESQYVRTKDDLYTRGSIFFTNRDGTELSAAAIKSGYVLALDPSRITDAAGTCTKLAEVAQIDQELCLVRAVLPGRTYVEFQGEINEATADNIVGLDLTGVHLYPEQWRYYPGASVAARSIGFVGFTDEGTELRGKYGLERQYDDVLFRQNQVRSVNFFAELFSDLGGLVTNTKQHQSGEIVTTLELSVSQMLDTVLQETNDQYDSKLTGAIIMDPNTGEIVAMNAVPGFDLNDRAGATIDQFQNPLVENLYEFGSTIKALTMAAGLDSGAIVPETTYYDSGELTLDTFTIRNFDGRGRGTVPMQEILNQSLNTGVSWIVTQMGKEQFRDYFLSYKLGSETGIDLPNEAFGLVDNLNSPRDVEYATASFGQGIAMTPIAVTRALATLGNGGHLVTPHIVKKINFIDGTEREMKYPEGTQVIKPETSEEISRMLTVVVDDALRNGTVALPNHTIAAKTGTAQIADPVNGGYYDDKYLHSFFGYFPSYDPEFIIFLYTVEPKGVRYASETLTTPFMDMTKFLINYYSIPPDR
jgi:cell division protein FtsI (penicillin-binding protein 3)/stage V sporulation protein D (sporulation-specific penicillin-binding protein)